MSENKLTADDIDSLKHMLGVGDLVSKRDWGYRNYFASGGGDHETSMERLVSAGLVVRGSKYGNSFYYHATEVGCKAAGLNDKQTKRALEP